MGKKKKKEYLEEGKLWTNRKESEKTGRAAQYGDRLSEYGTNTDVLSIGTKRGFAALHQFG